ncbi:magnesium/cobalt transporter CorA [Desulfoplanes formicivorans]|uniref:Magnesium transport protein CorA n=1 Tax=Desulfoplanes formicivorans TaxID=1592317 RepID=A0A194AHL3_9BACT|nr:magnesium/cobalt transporter CorA [Desulfoplanes formicivorans]GAU08254.1 magnesium transporter [Desulfoplanes formicivorans]
MARFLKKRDQQLGRTPGSPVFIGQQKIDRPRIRKIDYSASTLHDAFFPDMEGMTPPQAGEPCCWLNIDGLHDAGLMTTLGSLFNLPSLVLEDVVNTGQRPKFEAFSESVFVTLKMLFFDRDHTMIQSEQFSAILQDNCLLTFQEKPGDIFDPVRTRLQNAGGRLRNSGPDYLLYALLDCIFENYLKAVEVLGERIEAFDEEILEDPSSELLEEINIYRREVSYVRKAVYPAKEIVLRMVRTESELVSAATQPFVRDLADMVEQTMDAVDIYREMLSDHLSSYNMVMNNKLSETMKFLTMFATMFIPLSFLAGVYGMNFESMPELHFKHGYYVILGIMGGIAVAMLAYFKKKHWL